MLACGIVVIMSIQVTTYLNTCFILNVHKN